MSFRTVVITNRCKLDVRMNYLEIRSENTRKILLDDIRTLIIENPAVSLTGCLLEALVLKKVTVIFCDAKRNPYAELIPYYGSHDCSRKLKTQMEWDDNLKGGLWTIIVREKIKKQSDFLRDLQFSDEANRLKDYIDCLTFKDETNREGHAAKVYFNALFGKDFTRNDDNAINAALNYGYSLILSTVNREIVLNGYSTQLGIFHDNMFNQFNLSCDLMEPFRVVIDRFVYEKQYKLFSTEEKHDILKVLETEVGINNTRQILPNAIKIYVRSVFNALCERNISLVNFYTM